MVSIKVHYDGDLATRAEHPSGARIPTDAPLDNEGQGRHFSPTDLVGAALASCILTTIGIVARRHELDLRGAVAEVEKHMESGPRRIARLPVVVRIPGQFTPQQRRLLENAGRGCPVHRSLHPDLQAPIHFAWDPD